MKGKMYKALLIRVKKNFTRINGISISFNLNTIILLNERSLPLASRVIGPVYKEFRSKYSSKILLLSTIGI